VIACSSVMSAASGVLSPEERVAGSRQANLRDQRELLRLRIFRLRSYSSIAATSRGN
jgi:hypothetical protein